VEDIRKELEEIKKSRGDDKAGYMTAEEYREREARRLNVVIRGGRFLDFLDFQPVATGSRCKMLF
jgi:hypothetical protein